MTTGDIEAHLAELYDRSISIDTIGRITDAVVEDLGCRRPGRWMRCIR
jgi:transposase-like protein